MRSPHEIASSLSLLADLMDIIGENEFKIRAHRVAAEICSLYPDSSESLLSQINSPGIPKIGENLAKKIVDFSRKTETEELLELKKLVPLTVLELRRVPGLGPKKVKVLFQELKIESLDALERACIQGELKGLKGFGEKLQSKILDGILQLKRYKGLMRLSRAHQLFEKEVAILKQNFPDALVSATSELRRSCEVLHSVDLVVANVDPDLLVNFNVASGKFLSVLCLGNQIEIKTEAEELMRIFIVEKEDFAQTLFETTGSDKFVSWFKSRSRKSAAKFSSEEKLFAEVGISFIAPERREDENQELWANIKESEANNLIKVEDIKGIVHCHSTYSDGVDELAAMARAAKDQGYTYLGIADHSISAKYAGGLDEKKIKSQHKEIDKLNLELAPFRILKGIESDITTDGSLDYEDRILESFDFVVASIHNGFQMSQKEMTARIVKALKNPFTSILGHASGRLLLEREPYAVDLEEVIKVAADQGVIIEINASPYRLDLDWRMINFAVACGAKFSIDPDSHRIAGFNDIKYGVAVARKAGLRAEQVVTCLEADEFLSQLR